MSCTQHTENNDNLGMAMLIAESESGAYEPVSAVSSKSEAEEIARRLPPPHRGTGAGAIVSAGYNTVAGMSCGFTGPGDVVSANPLLGPLANNGGPTPTHLLLVGSPAIDAIPIGDCSDTNCAAIATDQRGFARPQGSACDISSVDVAGDTAPPVITPNVSGTLGSAGWYRSSVTVSWTVTDAESGIASSSGCGSSMMTADTTGVTLICSATNNAGLSASQSVTFARPDASGHLRLAYAARQCGGMEQRGRYRQLRLRGHAFRRGLGRTSGRYLDRRRGGPFCGRILYGRGGQPPRPLWVASTSTRPRPPPPRCRATPIPCR